MSALLLAFSNGLLIAAGLIMVIGAQNAYVLQQGLLKNHVFTLCTICFAADAMLIIAGVAGLGGYIARYPLILKTAAFLGAGILLFYAGKSLRAAFRAEALTAPAGAGQTARGPAVATLLALTFLNPHVYLDTVLLIGSISAQYRDAALTAFTAGAVSASGLWFYSLGYCAKTLSPVLARPSAWHKLNIAIALIMLLVAFSLLRYGLNVSA